MKVLGTLFGAFLYFLGYLILWLEFGFCASLAVCFIISAHSLLHNIERHK